MATGLSVLDRARENAVRVREGGRRLGSQRLQAIGVLGILGGMAGTVALRDPHIPGSLGICPSLLIFGVYCPGCGSLRALYDLTHGGVLEAMGHNMLMLSALIFLIGWSIVKLRGSPIQLNGPRQVQSVRSPLIWSIPLLVVIIGFALLRNLPESPLMP